MNSDPLAENLSESPDKASAPDENGSPDNSLPDNSLADNNQGCIPAPPFKPSARHVAVRAVMAVLQDEQQLEAALSAQAEYIALDRRDRAFARLMTATVFRRKGQIDAALGPFLTRQPPPFIMALLRVSAAQMLFLDTPPHAAIDEAVNLAKRTKRTAGFAGLVNAVLRRVDQKGRALAAQTPPRANIPKWLYKSWETAYGRAEARRFAQVLTDTPPLDITVKSGPEAWAEKLGGTHLYGQTVRLPKAQAITKLAGFDDGAWWVQDVSASLPVLALGDISGLSVLDLCAAPGGKTMQLAAGGAQVTSLDRSADRLRRLSANLERTGLNAEIIEADLLGWRGDKQFDVILLDVPCSASGTFRRHPDILYNKSTEQVIQLARLQKRLLKAAKQYLKPGGSLIYCSCSLEPEEGEQQIRDFLENSADFELKPIHLPGLEESISSEGYLRVTPSQWREKGGADGFFTAHLLKLS